ncbi:hypothetical protein MMC20_001738 [Loxospora ochrophaea]|nr:hypothetical protein [Loxospora ochrophaea]
MASTIVSENTVQDLRVAEVAPSIDTAQDKQKMDQPATVQDLILPEPPYKPEPIEMKELAIPVLTPTADTFSVYSARQKKVIIVTGSFAAFFSPVSSNIYFPALITIAKDLHVSLSQINLTVTTYQVMQGIAPMIVAGLSDEAGRRPAYFICFTLYTAANLGLALQDSFASLMSLRLLQSAGSSGTIALSISLVGDTCVPAERGFYMSWATLGDLLGPSISPIAGGLIAQKLNWHWIFWILLLVSVCFFVPLLLFLPETCRVVVGNGSIPPPILNMSLSDHLRRKSRKEQRAEVEQQQPQMQRGRSKLRMPNLLNTLKIAGNLDLFPHATTSFSGIYGFNDIQISLIFIPIGVGGASSALVMAKLIDWNFRRHERLLSLPSTVRKAQDLTDFPIEKARLELGLPLYLTAASFIIAYGWLLESHVGIAGPIVVLFATSFVLNASMQVLSTLMVDLWPGRSGAATAANNFFRCELGAVASAAIQPIINAMGRGWAYTTFALISAATTPLLAFVIKRGMARRKADLARKGTDQEMKPDVV